MGYLPKRIVCYNCRRRFENIAHTHLCPCCQHQDSQKTVSAIIQMAERICDLERQIENMRTIKQSEPPEGE